MFKKHSRTVCHDILEFAARVLAILFDRDQIVARSYIGDLMKSFERKAAGQAVPTSRIGISSQELGHAVKFIRTRNYAERRWSISNPGADIAHRWSQTLRCPSHDLQEKSR